MSHQPNSPQGGWAERFDKTFPRLYLALQPSNGAAMVALASGAQPVVKDFMAQELASQKQSIVDALEGKRRICHSGGIDCKNYDCYIAIQNQFLDEILALINGKE